MEQLFGNLSKPRIALGVFVATLVIGGGVGYAASSGGSGELQLTQGRLSDAKDDLAEAEADAESLLVENQSLEGELDELASEHEELSDRYEKLSANIDAIRLRLERKVRTYDAKLSDLKSREASLSAKEDEVARTQRKLDSELHRLNTTSFDDGVWQVGSDITPGIYRSPAGSSCYWAVLGSADTGDILNNGGFTKNQTVTLSEGQWFETSNCGTWKKIG